MVGSRHLLRSLKEAVDYFNWLIRNKGFTATHQDDYWMTNHPKSPFKAVAIPGPVTINQDGLATMTNCEFRQDARFQNAYRLGKETGSWGMGLKDDGTLDMGRDVEWRIHVSCWAADYAKNLEGDFVECGVNRGGFARAIVDYIHFSKLDKTYYLLDTYEGFDERYLSEEEKRRWSSSPIMTKRYQPCFEAVKETFKDFNTRIIKGAVPETLEQVDTQKVCFLSIDMNCVEPEIAAAEFFWDRLVPGGVVVLDDYGWVSHQDQKTAFDEFARGKNISILTLPTGQGLYFKPPNSIQQSSASTGMAAASMM